MQTRSSIAIVYAEECGRVDVSELKDFGIAVRFDVVVAGLGVAEGDDDLFETIFLVERLVLDLFLLLLVCHGVPSGGYIAYVWWLCYYLLVFLDLLKLDAWFHHLSNDENNEITLVVVAQNPEWKFKVNIAKNVTFEGL